MKYFAEVEEVLEPDEADLERPATEYVDRAKLEPGKKVVKFKQNSLRELEDPILFQTKYPQALRYTTLRSFLRAETTDDLL